MKKLFLKKSRSRARVTEDGIRPINSEFICCGAPREKAKNPREVRALEQTARTLVADRIPSWTERLVFCAMVIVSVGSSHATGTTDSTSGSLFGEILWGAAYAAALGFCLLRREFVFQLAKMSIPLLLILVLAILSTLWSGDAFTTAKRAICLCGTTAIGFYIVSRYSLIEFVKTLVMALVLTGVISFVLIITSSDGIDPDSGDWRGIFFQKNGLGVTMALAIASIQSIITTVTGRSRFILGACMALCGILLVGARSGTAFVTLGVLAVTYFFLARLRVRGLRVPAIFAFSALALVGVCAYGVGFGVDDALGLLGKDATLTGRSDVWLIATQHIADRPTLGYGYRYFWDTNGPVHAYLLKDIGWEPDSAHNGYLEILLNFGFVGGIVFLTFFLQGIARAFKLFIRSGAGVGAWPLLVVLYEIISNFTETSIGMYNSVTWVVLISAILYAAEASLEAGGRESQALTFATKPLPAR